MKIDVNNTLTIILGVITLVAAIYRLAQVESSINSKIANLEKKLDIHLTEYNEKKIFVEYRLHDADKKIEHKFNRLAGWIKQVAGYLSKEHDFHIRDDQF